MRSVIICVMMALAGVLDAPASASNGAASAKPQTGKPQPAASIFALPDSAPSTPGQANSPRMAVGTNLDANAYYDSGGKWVDAANQFSGWFGCKHYGPHGYPQETADCICHMIGYPAGTYHLSYEGAATLAIEGAKLENLQQTGNLTTADVIVPRANNYLRMHVTGLDPSRPVQKLKLICPGYDLNTTEVFRPEYTKWLSCFTTLRFMDWELMNNNTQKHWNQRIRPDDWDQTSFGVAYEYMVRLANDTHKDAWVCVPLEADDDYVRELALLFKQVKGKVHVELSNELWNDAMKVQFMANWKPANEPPTLLKWDGKIEKGKIAPYNDANGKQTPGTNGRVRAARRAAEQAAHVGRIFRGVFANRASDLKVVWAGQAMWDAWARDGLEWVDARTPGGAGRAFDELAVAPYITFGNRLPQHATIDQCFAACRDYLDLDLAPNLEAHAELARKYHLAPVAYEGGQHLFPWTDPLGASGDLPTHMQTDPRMGDLYRRLLSVCQNKGFVLFMNFSYIGPWSKFGYWGVLQGNAGPVTPRYEALTDWSAGK